MKAVLKQQLQLHKNRVLVLIGILVLFYLITSVSAIISNKQIEKYINLNLQNPILFDVEELSLEDKLDFAFGNGFIDEDMIYDNVKTKQFAEITFVLAILVGTLGMLIMCVAKGPGSAEDMLFKDTSYLMKTVPCSSWAIFGGKLIIGLLEFFIYCVMFAVFLLIYLSIHSVAFTDISIWSAIGEFLLEIGKHFGELFNLACFVLLFYVFLQITVNFTLTAYYALCKDKKWTKILLVVLAILFVRFAIRVTTFFVDFTKFDLIRSSSELWPPVLILMAVAAIYYALTCVIYDKKINL